MTALTAAKVAWIRDNYDESRSAQLPSVADVKALCDAHDLLREIHARHINPFQALRLPLDLCQRTVKVIE